jgi:replicative DNA helicase
VSVPAFVSPIDRIPPNNLEAEMALLGSILVDKEMMSAVSEIVRPDDFYASLHESIYRALYALYESGKPLDKVALAEELRSRGMLDKIGGLAYLTSLMDTVPTAASAEYYAKIVREKASLRQLIHAGTRITQLGYESEDDVPAALDESEQIVYDVGNRDQRGSFSSVSSLLLDTFYKLETRHAQSGERTGVTSGFGDIDAYTAGFQRGNLIILAARPAMGKTSLALNMALFAAREEREAVAIFSLEMTKQELIERLISSEATIDASKLRRGAIEQKEWQRIGDAIGKLNDLPIYLDDSGAVTVSEIRSRLRRLKSTHGLAIAYIDYLQLVRPSSMNSRNVNRNEELSEICRTLKATAKDLEIPIVALAQLNRAVETRQDKRPMLSDLRDCLSGEALVTNADTGERVRLIDIVEGNLRFNVWALDEHLQMTRRPITDAWAVGEKPLCRVFTRSGRTIEATDGHRFLTVSGWKKLRDIAVGEAVAVPRTYRYGALPVDHVAADRALLLGWLVGDGHFGGSTTLTVATPEEADFATCLAASTFGLRPTVKPEHEGTSALRVAMTTGFRCGAGKNPLTTWLRELGLWKCTGSRKHAPAWIFHQERAAIAGFLRGLFHADGSLSRRRDDTHAVVRLATISEQLARDVQHLLLRLDIAATVSCDRRNIGGYRTQTSALWTVSMRSRSVVTRFLDTVGFLGAKHERAVIANVRDKQNDAGQIDRIPLAVNGYVRERRLEHQLSHAALGWRDQGKSMSRETCAALADRLDDELLERLAYSDVIWDPIERIDPAGVATAYDLTVDDLHNFCVDDFVTHNSGAIEQEADIVTFLYRDAYYNKETSPEPDATEFIFAKHRNGKVGTVKLRFRAEHTLFQPYGDDSHYPAP